MVAVKKLKPYFIKADENNVRVILDYEYFSLIIDKEVYHFVPFKAKEILINRQTRKIVNMSAIFTFKNGEELIHIGMPELVLLPDFLIQLHTIVEPYYANNNNENDSQFTKKSVVIIDELEQLNIRRLIDKALDERDEELFYKLVKLL
ncbi:IDEAL domain-containing protein [Virgibacillus ndiopensis]|uniref:IDEAL domain-containing protein n=1 Tax=Virgibacillus ndiopensis TaxID=2004408 RepID=UPI000C089580|nr:IDEAL domain-containing protein [Virgibacillus ndiopensis]